MIPFTRQGQQGVCVYEAVVSIVPIQRDQLHQRDVLVDSLQRELGRVAGSRQSLSRQQLLERAEESTLARENATLRDDNTRLSEELRRMAEKNRKLEEVCPPFPVYVPSPQNTNLAPWSCCNFSNLFKLPDSCWG